MVWSGDQRQYRPPLIAALVAAASKRRVDAMTLRSRLFAEPLGVIGLALVVLVVVAALGADMFARYSPIALDIRHRLQPPDWDHLLGTDQLGRDVFARVLFGARIALWVSMVSVGAALALGSVLGMAAGYGPRWLDNVLMLVFDAVRSFPTVLFALALVALIGPSLGTIIVVVVVTAAPVYGRIARTQTLSLKATDFIIAERTMGAGWLRVLARHMLPNMIGPLLILASMDVPVVITIESGLSFLGFGVRPPTPSWGSILNDGYGFIRDTPWPVIAGGLPIVITTLGFTFLGETLRDLFDPRLQKTQ
jgi:peptide/nickel transport system permease protein